MIPSTVHKKGGKPVGMENWESDCQFFVEYSSLGSGYWIEAKHRLYITGSGNES